MLATEKQILEMLDEEHTLLYTEAVGMNAKHFVLYHWLLTTIPDTMPEKQKKRHQHSLLRQMDKCMGTNFIKPLSK